MLMHLALRLLHICNRDPYFAAFKILLEVNKCILNHFLCIVCYRYATYTKNIPTEKNILVQCFSYCNVLTKEEI